MLNDWETAVANETEEAISVWQKPAQGFVKCNLDADILQIVLSSQCGAETFSKHICNILLGSLGERQIVWLTH